MEGGTKPHDLPTEAPNPRFQTPNKGLNPNSKMEDGAKPRDLPTEAPNPKFQITD
jgi:hypothetical protein